VKSKRFKFTVLLVLTLALFSWRIEAAVNTKPLSDRAFIELCRAGTAREVKDTIKAGVDVNAIDPDGISALMNAAMYNPDPEVTITLIKSGADVNYGDADGWTALMSAASNNNLEVITALIKNGAEVNAIDSDYGMTALMWAARSNNNPEVIITLLESGADAKIRDNDGKMAIDYARNNHRIVNTDAFQKLNELSPTTTTRQSAAIKGNSVRIRSEPDTSDADNILYRADSGLIVAVIDYRQVNPDELWYFIEYQPGSFGWVRSDLLTLE